jgi:predicted TIM-barrel fold metal-dependent hydrolase
VEAPTVLRAAGLAGGRLSPFAAVDPVAPEAAERVEDWLERGMKGVVLFPALHGYRVDGPQAARVLGVLARHEALAVVHCGLLQVPLRERFGLPRGTDLTLADPLHLVPAASAHPRVRFVVPHFGAGFFRETLMLGKQCGNVLVDTSSSNGWLATQPAPLSLADVFERTLRVFGPERILFGTDSSVFPRGWRHDILTAQREALGANGLSELDRRQILHGNAVRVLRLEG